MSIILRRPYTQKPPAGVRPNLGHSQLKGCSAWFPFLGRSVRDAISGRLATSDTGGWTINEHGLVKSYDADSNQVTRTGINLGTPETFHTWSVWIRNGSTTDGNGTVCGFVINTDNRWGLKIDGGGSSSAREIVFMVEVANVKTSMKTNVTPNAISTTGWHHVVGVKDSTSDPFGKIYIDGVSVTVASGDISVIDNGYPGEIIIGSSDIGWSWGGQINDVRFYNRALTVAEVKSIYANPYAPFTRNIYIPQAAAAATTTFFLPLWRPMTTKPSHPVS